MKTRSFFNSSLPAVAGALAAVILMGSSAANALLFDQNITPDVIFGSGNANGSWTVDQNMGVEVGLRAKVRFDEAGSPQNIFNSLGNGMYIHRAGQFMGNGRANWSFEWSINTDYDGSGSPLDSGNLNYRIEMDNDPTALTNFLMFDPILSGCADHALGINTTGNGGGTSHSCPGDAGLYAAQILTDNVAQNSWQLNFFTGAPFNHPFDPDAIGEYEFRLSVLDGSTLKAQTTITVKTIPEPGTLALFGLGLAGLGIARRRKTA